MRSVFPFVSGAALREEELGGRVTEMAPWGGRGVGAGARVGVGMGVAWAGRAGSQQHVGRTERRLSSPLFHSHPNSSALGPHGVEGGHHAPGPSLSAWLERS